jgi:hypothetical protein
MLRKVIIPVLLVMFTLAGAVSAQNWKKLGQKDVDFHIDHDRIIARDKGKIREIHLSVSKAPVKFQKIVINYKNGEKQEVEYLENVAMGHESRSVTIEGTGRVISSIDLWYETNSLGGKKAKVTAYGRS